MWEKWKFFTKKNLICPPFHISLANTFSEFLWFKNPGGEDAPYQGPWEVGHMISENDCDTYMDETVLTVEGVEYDVIFTTGYFMNKLSVYWNAEGMWDNATEVMCNHILIIKFFMRKVFT